MESHRLLPISASLSGQVQRMYATMIPLRYFGSGYWRLFLSSVTILLAVQPSGGRISLLVTIPFKNNSTISPIHWNHIRKEYRCRGAGCVPVCVLSKSKPVFHCPIYSKRPFSPCLYLVLFRTFENTRQMQICYASSHPIVFVLLRLLPPQQIISVVIIPL